MIKDKITLNKQEDHYILFEAKVTSEKEDATNKFLNMTLLAEEVYEGKSRRKEFNHVTYAFPVKTKDFKFNQNIYRNSESHKIIFTLSSQLKEPESHSVGLLSEVSSSKDSIFLESKISHSENKKNFYEVSVSEGNLDKGIDDLNLPFDQLPVFESLREDIIPKTIDSKTASFNKETKVMTYKDFRVKTPQRILPKSDFLIELFIAPTPYAGVTKEGHHFDMKIEGLGELRLLDGSLRFRPEGAHTEEDQHVIFDKPVDFKEFFTNDYTERAKLQIRGSKEGNLSIVYNAKEANMSYDNTATIENIYFQGASFEMPEGTEDDPVLALTNRTEAKVANVSIKFRK